MCDTLGVLQGSYALFGKNSDRSPNETQITEFYPARMYDGGEVACTYRLIPQARETLSVLLSRPVWMWGAEIGVTRRASPSATKRCLPRENTARLRSQAWIYCGSRWNAQRAQSVRST